MFTFIRIINGIISLVALFGFYLFASMKEPSLKMIAVPLGLVVILYALDLMFREACKRSDMVYGTMWTIIHFGTLSLATKRLAEGDFGSQYLEISFLAWTVALGFMPFLANLTYLLKITRKKANT